MSGQFFDKTAVLAGLHTAMDFGAPNTAADRATFYMPRNVTSDDPADSKGVPFDPDASRVLSPLVKKTVRCAVEFFGVNGKETDFGTLTYDKVKLTVLGPDFTGITGFEYVVISGSKYLYWKEEPVIALGSIDVHQVWCKAEDVH